MRAGEDAATVIERLGDPSQLAQAYRVELAISGARRPLRRVARVFALIGVTAVSSLASFVVIVVLGALTLALIGGGAAAIFGGIASLLLPGDFVTMTLPIPQTISELLAMGLGVVMTLAGLLSGVLLFFYVRMVVRGFRRITGRLRAARALARLVLTCSRTRSLRGPWTSIHLQLLTTNTGCTQARQPPESRTTART